MCICVRSVCARTCNISRMGKMCDSSGGGALR